MRCQICNKETDDWTLNKQTGKYESICNDCRKQINKAKRFYTDFENCDNLDDLKSEEFITFLKREDDNAKQY